MGRKGGGRRGASRKGGGGGAGEKSPAEAAVAAGEFGPSKAAVKFRDGDGEEAKQQIREVFGRDLSDRELASLTGAPAGAKVTVKSTYSPSEFELEVSHPDIEEALRTISKDRNGDVIIHNDMFKTKVQGTGFGSEMVGRQMEQAAKLGVKKVDTFAARYDDPDPKESYVGYKVWPKFGYDGPLADNTRKLLSASTLPAAQKGATKLSDLYKTEAGQKWWDQNGQGINLSYDLTPGSYSRKVMDAYQARRQARTR